MKRSVNQYGSKIRNELLESTLAKTLGCVLNPSFALQGEGFLV